jgi:hypothetical protein
MVVHLRAELAPDRHLYLDCSPAQFTILDQFVLAVSGATMSRVPIKSSRNGATTGSVERKFAKEIEFALSAGPGSLGSAQELAAGGEITPDLAPVELVSQHADRKPVVDVATGLAAEDVRVVLGLEVDHAPREGRRMLRVRAERKGGVGEGGH